VLWKSGREREARPFLSESTDAARKALDGGSESPYDRYYLAQAAAIQGQKEDAFRWLEDAIQAGWLNYRLSTRDPLLENLRGEARFEKLLADMEAKVNDQRTRLNLP
jgi:hypothetical protein